MVCDLSPSDYVYSTYAVRLASLSPVKLESHRVYSLYLILLGLIYRCGAYVLTQR